MKISVYGAGKYGRYVYDEIVKNKDTKISIVCWIDNFIKESKICELPVYTEAEFLESERFKEIDCVVVAMASTQAEEAIASLLLHEYTNIYMVLPTGLSAEIPILTDEGNFSSFVKYYKDIKPRLSYMEIAVIHRCNLNCKRCAYFSNLEHSDWFLDVSKLESYLGQLKKKFHCISRFNLVGGEPLLNLSLDKYISLVRKYFPRTSIAITTNGLLIPEISQALIETMKQCQALFYISQYPVTRKRLEQIIDFLEREQLIYEITLPRTQFKKMLNVTNQDGKKAFEKWRRSMCTCHSIDDGRVCICSNISRLYTMQEYFNIHIEKEEVLISSIDLMSDEVSGWDVLKYFAQPASLCRFCSPEDALEPWETGSPKKEDWISG